MDIFFKKDFLFYLPKINKYKIIKAKDESEAVWKLCNYYRLIEGHMENYRIIKNFDIIK